MIKEKFNVSSLLNKSSATIGFIAGAPLLLGGAAAGMASALAGFNAFAGLSVHFGHVAFGMNLIGVPSMQEVLLSGAAAPVLAASGAVAFHYGMTIEHHVEKFLKAPSANL